MKYAQIVMGPAGSGKSTYCRIIQDHCDTLKRTAHVVNLDPAAEEFGYSVSMDIRELISLEDVMEELSYGPNGGLLYCMEYLTQNMDWLRDEIQDYSDDYLLIDLPGQVELYMHHSHVIRAIVRELQNNGYSVGAVYCMDSQFIDDPSKFIAGALMSLSAMVNFEIPMVSVLTKVDLLQEEDKKLLVDEYLTPDVEELAHNLSQHQHSISNRFHSLNKVIASLISDYGMVSFLPLDISDEDSVGYVLSMIDHSIQYGEDEEPRDPIQNDGEDNDNDFDNDDDDDNIHGRDFDENASGLDEHQRYEALWRSAGAL